MFTTGRLRRTSPLLIAIAILALLATLPGEASLVADRAHAEDEPLQIHPEEPQLAVIEVEDQYTLSLLASSGIDLDHYTEPTEDGRVRSVALVTEADLDELAAMDVEVLGTEPIPTADEIAAQRMGAVDGFEVLQSSKARSAAAAKSRGDGQRGGLGKQPPRDSDSPLRVLRADTFTNYVGDFLSVEVRSAGGTAANLLQVDGGATYDLTGAAFGPTLISERVTGPFAVVNASGADPSQGCGPLTGFPSGAIAIADRGGCSFVEIAAYAQAAGASAVVVVNNVAGAPIELGGADASITIPSGMVSLADGNALKASLPASGAFQGNAIVLSYEIDGQEFSEALSVFNDAGQYIYHRTPRPRLVPGIPTEITITGAGDQVTVPTEPWADYDTIGYPDGFQWGFITTGYPDPVDSYNKIEELAAEFPDLAEIIEMPYETHGYRRPAMLTYGQFTNTAVVLRSQAYGHEGGNDLTFQIVNPGAADQPLSVSVSGDDITVSAATGASGAITSTAAQVIAAINADAAASALVYAHPYRGNAATGMVTAGSRSGLSDFLNAPEDKISREPATVKAIRIGKHRDGSRTGVFAYSQEHAREWVTPVVALEAAERLLRNYGSDPDTTRYVDELDIFIAPSINPDGTNYSLYDNAAQRRNMVNYCADNFADSAYRTAWGVDLNRNFTIGSLFDGYSGASTSCTSDVFAGPSELSEAEAKNEDWLIRTNPNIRFSMNIHTHGGYFMWAPGAYRTPGRIPLPRPSLGTEQFFFAASDTILSKIAEHRGTVIEPGRTGPIIDVLYSAAGNSADHFFYTSLEEGRPIYGWSFEAGANIYTGQGATGWVSPGGFFPDWASEGFDQSMEFASGVYGILEVAHQFEVDDEAPVASPNLTPGGWYDGYVDVFWDLSEPADIYYTTDGSRPTFDSPMVDRRDARDSAAPVRIEGSTTLRWFAVDAAGNVSGGYDPDGSGRNYDRITVRIRDVAPGASSTPTRPTVGRGR